MRLIRLPLPLGFTTICALQVVSPVQRLCLSAPGRPLLLGTRFPEVGISQPPELLCGCPPPLGDPAQAELPVIRGMVSPYPEPEVWSLSSVCLGLCSISVLSPERVPDSLAPQSCSSSPSGSPAAVFSLSLSPRVVVGLPPLGPLRALSLSPWLLPVPVESSLLLGLPLVFPNGQLLTGMVGGCQLKSSSSTGRLLP